MSEPQHNDDQHRDYGYIYLVNKRPGEEAAYQVTTEDEAKVIMMYDNGASHCTFKEYRKMMHRMENQ